MTQLSQLPDSRDDDDIQFLALKAINSRHLYLKKCKIKRLNFEKYSYFAKFFDWLALDLAKG